MENLYSDNVEIPKAGKRGRKPGRPRLRHSMLRKVGDVPVYSEVAVMVVNGAVANSQAKEQKKSKLPKKEPGKRKRKKITKKKTRIQPAESSNSLLTSSLKAKAAELSDIQRNVKLHIAPIVPAKHHVQEELKFTPMKKPPPTSTPGIPFAKVRQKMEIINASRIEKEPNGEYENYDDDMNPDSAVSPVIEPAMLQYPHRRKSTEYGENAISHFTDADSKSKSSDQEPLEAPPSIEVLRLRSGKCIDKSSIRINLSKCHELGSYEAKEEEAGNGDQIIDVVPPEDMIEEKKDDISNRLTMEFDEIQLKDDTESVQPAIMEGNVEDVQDKAMVSYSPLFDPEYSDKEEEIKNVPRRLSIEISPISNQELSEKTDVASDIEILPQLDHTFSFSPAPSPEDGQDACQYEDDVHMEISGDSELLEPVKMVQQQPDEDIEAAIVKEADIIQQQSASVPGEDIYDTDTDSAQEASNDSEEEDANSTDDDENSPPINAMPAAIARAVKSRQSIMLLNPERSLYRSCQQHGPIHWTDAFPKGMIERCVKIGEGSFGEVFRTIDETNSPVVLKVVPIEGAAMINLCPQAKFGEIWSEVAINLSMSQLRNHERNATTNFVELKKVRCVRGCYPQRLLDAWDAYDQQKESENDRPDTDLFPETQLFVIFVFGDGGVDLEKATLKSTKVAKSIVKQLAMTLAIAERQLEFEHRDLHWGNVLIKETDDTHIDYMINGNRVQVESHGIQVFIIDFTNSRLIKDGEAVYVDLGKDPELFTAEGDYQFDIYRIMQDINGNEWKTFLPQTNLLWLDYVVDKLISEKKYGKKRPKRMTQKQRQPFDQLRSAIMVPEENANEKEIIYENTSQLISQSGHPFFEDIAQYLQ